MEIRDAEAADWEAIWAIFQPIVAAGETYEYPRRSTSEQGRQLWMLEPPGRTAVAVADDGVVVGTSHMNPNRLGAGSHVANASYMVHPDKAGRGIGRALVVESLEWAKNNGYRAMQFNAVVDTNAGAVGLYEKLGFTIIGTVPEAFLSPSKGYVGLHVMHRFL
ncbi:GNAT family N-acetyltransferase [Microlunatus elymi]|uniref:GNAT family N-acetyltransferase n=1 Tax=Microlunatus elymi TaxID=2596828 RepID=A0A516PTT8_9ACTN|nr:GNAT family N-acetyltransferase [Microlunatus elymi]QDP94573.1 GNAT family N-acetyltransferase [Microlunatus elymi]